MDPSDPEPDGHRPVESDPPGPPPAPGDLPGAADAQPDPSGPPPPPFVRERAARRRRILLASGVGALVLLAAGAALAVGWPGVVSEEVEDVEAADDGEGTDPDDGAGPDTSTEEPGTGEEPGDGGETGSQERSTPDIEADIQLDLDEDGRPDRDVPGDERIVAPDVDGLDDDQRPIAELLLDIDASERSMLGFQLDAQEAFSRGDDPDDPDVLDDRVRGAAAYALEALAVLRERMQTPQDDPWAEQVRETYVIHLDSWVSYLEAVHDEPRMLLGDTTRYTVDINRTGAAFVRAVNAPTVADIDDEVADYADELVERGFPDPEDSQV